MISDFGRDTLISQMTLQIALKAQENQKAREQTLEKRRNCHFSLYYETLERSIVHIGSVLIDLAI